VEIRVIPKKKHRNERSRTIEASKVVLAVRVF